MRNNKGFSLVELIVVIAIMAVLASVAVIGVSVYVPKAQEAKDKQLVSDVEYALDLYYQSHAGDMTGGYVIITTRGTQASGGAAKAMDDVFGAGWDKNKLAYDGWNSNVNSLMNMVAGYAPEKFQSIAGSSFMSPNMTTEGMMGAVGDLLSTAAGSINPGSSKGSTLSTLRMMGVKEDILAKLSDIYDNDATQEKDDFRTAVANALVGCYSGKIDEAYSSNDTDQINGVDNDGLTKLMCFYANAYAYQEAMKGTDKAAEAAEFYTAVGAAISKVEAEGLAANNLGWLNGGQPDVAGYKALERIGENEVWEDLLRVVGKEILYSGYRTNFGAANSTNNDTALKNMMGAVSSVAQNAQDLTNPDLFASPEIAEQMNAYRYAIQVKQVLGSLPAVNDNEIVVLLLEDGTIFSTIPADN